MKNVLAYDGQDHVFAQIRDFQFAFSQPTPKYAQKSADGWRTIPHTLTYRAVRDHLEHRRTIGTLGRWYPSFGILDFDDVPISYVEQTRANLGMDDRNSVLFSSESADSYHLYFRPMAGDKSPTLRYYQKSMHYVAQQYCEVYPQANRVIRLPFGAGQDWVKNGIRRQLDYTDGMAMLMALDGYQLADRWHGEVWDEVDAQASMPQLDRLQAGWKRDGLHYLNAGLEDAGSRYHATMRVIYFYWSQNVTPEVCIESVKKWIKSKNNGYSEDWKKNYRAVYRQIEQLTLWMYQNFAKKYILPDVPQLIDHGYHTQASVRAVVEASGGSLPVIKFALPLVSYCVARGGRGVSVHRDRLVDWGSTANYVRYVERLEQAGLLHRHNHYSVENFAKKIDLQIPKMDVADGISTADDEARAEHDAKRLIMASYTPTEYYHTQRRNKCAIRAINSQIEEIWGEAKPAELQLAKLGTVARIAQYRSQYPLATQEQASSELNIPLRTIKRYWQNESEKSAKSGKK